MSKNMMDDFENNEQQALLMDKNDPLKNYREKFLINPEKIYFCGNSLGLQPKTTGQYLRDILYHWHHVGVDAHLSKDQGWLHYFDGLLEPMAKIVGAKTEEVVIMNSLTVNLHLMLMSFYRPTKKRYKILRILPSFPSDVYALNSHLQARGYSPEEAIISLSPQTDDLYLAFGQIEEVFEQEGDTIALILFDGVNYLTGQYYPIKAITDLAHQHGALVGVDFAHGAGNVELKLHDWAVDFSVWCTYKYLNSGPGGVAAAFIHNRHCRDVSIPRLAGWWGNQFETRFKMFDQIDTQQSASGWQLSNPPILLMGALAASLDVFSQTSMSALCEKSRRLTGYLRFIIESNPSDKFDIITPSNDQEHGCQLSLRVKDQSQFNLDLLERAGVVCDFREPNMIRVAPTPLYNTYHEVWRFGQVL